jgi:hypothetical protein
MSNRLRVFVALLAYLGISSPLAMAQDAVASPPGQSTTTTAAKPKTEPALDALIPMALSPAEGIAVVRYPDRHMRTMRVGEEMGATRARLRQVLPDRLVLEESSESGGKQIVWLFRPQQAGDPAVVQRVSGTAPVVPLLANPNVHVVPTKPTGSGSGGPSLVK